MREALKNVFGKELILEDGSCFIYTVQPYEIKNVLGFAVALLDEYSFTKKGETVTYKLYRTKEGNWYNMDENKDALQTKLFLEIKTAMGVIEKEF